MIDEKYLMKVLENWSEYWGKKSDGYSRLKWIMTIRFKALIKNFTKIGEWIPCSERLPEEKGWYLVYAKNQRPFVAYFKGKTFPLNNHYHEIIAWMPLPEPYRET